MTTNRGLKELEIDTDRINTTEAEVGRSLCDSCLLDNLATYLCYDCGLYMCDDCFKGSEKGNNVVKFNGDKLDRDDVLECMLSDMRNKRIKEEIFHEEIKIVTNRVKVKYYLDETYCSITGICKLADKNWILVDSHNRSLKVVTPTMTNLLRYIKFGLPIYDATEITEEKLLVHQERAVYNRAAGSFSANNDTETGKCLLAVTLSTAAEIWLINLNSKSVRRMKRIFLDFYCYKIEYFDSKIFTLCSLGNFNGVDRVYIISSNGDILHIIKNSEFGVVTEFTSRGSNIFMTDYLENKILAVNNESGNIIYEMKIHGSGPKGIAYNPVADKLYVCAMKSNEIYELDRGLQSYRPFKLDKKIFRNPWKIHIHKDVLAISHDRSSALRNYITILQIT